MNTQTDAPGTRLPVSAFIVVAMWAALETLLFVLTDVDNRTTNPLPQKILRALMHGGMLASLLMATAWLVYGADATTVPSRSGALRRIGFHFFVGSIAVAVAFALAFSLSGPVTDLSHSTAGILMAAAGAIVPLVLVRSYFGFRVVHGSRKCSKTKTVRQSEMSIRRLLAITALLASLLGACRMLVGGLSSEILSSGVSGFLWALIWLATAIWMLGRWRYGAVTLSTFAIAQVFEAFLNWPDFRGNGEEVIVSVVRMLGVQLHLLLFLAVVRAGQFRFSPR